MENIVDEALSDASRSNQLKDVKVLIVEDSPTQTMILEALLKIRGCSVKTAANGHEAIEKLKKEIPTIVISDVVMPGMSGYELCKTMKANPELKEIPVILLTSLFDPVDVIKAIECGADNFLVKPCPKQLLYFHIENILENRKIRREVTADNTFDFYFGGVRYHLPMNPLQITDLLLSTYSSATSRSLEYQETSHELHALKNELIAKNDELERVKEEKNRLMEIAQHYLRPSLTMIQSDCTFLINTYSEKLGNEILPVVEKMKNTSYSVLKLMSEFIGISTVEAVGLRGSMRKQDLKVLIQQNLELNQQLAAKKDVQLSFTADDNIPEVLLDSYRFEQALNILISNAMKFSPPRGLIEIHLTKTTSEVLISISDQGPGIPKSQVEQLFGLYGRISRKNGAEEGSGLSLAIAKNIVLEQRGRIWVETEEGKGSTFWVALPIL